MMERYYYQFREWIESQLNARVSYALIALATAFGFALFLELQERSIVATSRVQTLRTQLVQLQDLRDLEGWEERASAARELSGQWEAKKWSAATTGVAAAEIQSLLRSVAAENNLSGVRLTADSEPTFVQGQPVIQFEFAGQVPIDNFLPLMAALQTNEKRLILIEVSYARGVSRGTLRCKGIAPITLETAGESAS